MPTKRQDKPGRLPPPPSKRLLGRWEKQRNWQHIIVIASSVVIGAVIIFVAASFLREEILPRYEPVLRVNDTTWDLAYYRDVLELYAAGQDPSQISFIASIAARDIQYNEVMRRGALDLGIEVGEQEIADVIALTGLPPSEALNDLVRSTLLVDKLRSEYFDMQVPTHDDQVNAFAMLLESEQSALEVKTRLDEGEDFAALAGGLSLDFTTLTRDGELGWLPRNLARDLLNTDLVWDAAFALEPGEVSTPVVDAVTTRFGGYWIIQVTEMHPVTETREVRAILLPSFHQAEEIRARLEAGEAFAALAMQFSHDELSREVGGELGLLPERMSAQFNEWVLQAEELEISPPVRDDTVQTTGGVWLVKLVEKETDRLLEQDVRENLISQAFEDWVEALVDEAVIESYLDAEKLGWAIDRLPRVRAG